MRSGAMGWDGRSKQHTPRLLFDVRLQVHVGLSGDDGVILEFELEGEGEAPHQQGWLRAGHEALR